MRGCGRGPDGKRPVFAQDDRAKEGFTYVLTLPKGDHAAEPFVRRLKNLQGSRRERARLESHLGGLLAGRERKKEEGQRKPSEESEKAGQWKVHG